MNAGWTLFSIVILTIVPSVEGAGDVSICRIPADADILGLGVRLGHYFQLLSSGIIVVVRPAESLSSLSVSNMLFSGIFIAI